MADLANAKRIAWLSPAGGLIRLAYRSRPGISFSDEDSGADYSEDELCDQIVRVLEEFPAPKLSELVGEHDMFEIQSPRYVYVALRVQDEDGAEDWAFVRKANAGLARVVGFWRYLDDAQRGLHLDPATLVLWCPTEGDT